MRRLLLFAAVLAAFGVRHLSWISDQTAEWINLATPFAVVAAAAAVLAQLEARGASLAVAVVGGILYVDGHGMHLAADSIRSEGLSGDAERVAHFWDERLSHWELHSGLILIVVAFCLARPGCACPSPRFCGRPSQLSCCSEGRSSPASSKAGRGGCFRPPPSASARGH